MTSYSGFWGDTPVRSRFLLEIDKKEIGVFSEISGLQMSIETHKHTEGGENGYTHQFPGRITWPNIVLKGGITDSDAMFQWVLKTAGDGLHKNHDKLTRSTGAITIIDTMGNRERGWLIQGAFPVKWSGPSFDVMSGDPLKEELELAHDGFTSKSYNKPSAPVTK